MRIRRFSPALVAAFALTLAALQVSNLVGGRQLRLMAVAGLIGFILILPRPRPSQWVTRRGLVASVYVATLIGAILMGRANGFGSWGAAVGDILVLLVAFALGARLVARPDSATDLDSRLLALAIVPSVYVAVNVLLHFSLPFLPLTPPEANSVAEGQAAGLLDLLGITTTRTQFPLTRSINNFAVVAAAGLASSALICLRVAGWRRWVTACLGASCVCALLLSDARLPAFLGVAVALTLSLPTGPRFARPAMAIGFVAPLIFAAVAPWIAENLGVLSRGSGDLGTLNGRAVIWEGATGVLASPSFEQIFGFGANGQLTSGASASYAYLFDSDVALSMHVHNALLQTTLESGYLGLIALIAAAWVTVGTLAAETSHRDPKASRAVLGATLTILLAGATESTPTLVSTEATFYFVMVVGAGAVLPTVWPGIAAKEQHRSQRRHNRPVAGEDASGGTSAADRVPAT